MGKVRRGIAGVTAVGAFPRPQILEVNNLPFDSLNRVVFKSGAEGVAAQQYSESSGLILAKKIRGLVVVNAERLPGFPDIPPAKEVGYPGLNGYGWQGVSGPAKLPKETVDKWDKTLEEACKDPAFLERAAKIYKGVAYVGPREFWEFIQEEYKRYLPLAIKMGTRK